MWPFNLHPVFMGFTWFDISATAWFFLLWLLYRQVH